MAKTIDGKKVKAARLAAGMTQAELSEASGRVRELISKVENGYKDVSFKTLGKLADALNVDMTDLLTE
jgi:transcriptional regulator with XRE-family HTH domain